MEIPLKNIPNQKVSVHLEGHYFDITLKEVDGCMYCTIDRNGERVISSMPCVPFAPLIPYPYLEGGAGNFHFAAMADQYPHYSRFESTDRLFYTNAATIATIRAETKGRHKVTT